MLDEKKWRVDIRLSYTVRALSPDAALSAVLPLVSLGMERFGPQPEIVDYTVRERNAERPADSPTLTPPTLSKAVYTAKEVAEILNVSVASVYGRIPAMRIGGMRRYSRAVIEQILAEGKVPEPPPSPTPVYHERRRYAKPPRVTSRQARKQKPEPEAKGPLTLSEAAKILRISKYKLRQLLDAKKIHHFSLSDGKRRLWPDAIEHYIAGGTPRQLVEKHIAQAQNDPASRDEQDMVASVAAQWREEWPE